MESPRPGYALLLTAPVAEELRRVTREQLDAATAHLAAAAEGADPAVHVHETRKAMKALRALLRLVRGALDSVAFDREDVAFRDVARLLASLRERTAAWAALEALEARSAGAAPPAPPWRRARDHLAAVIGSVDAGRPPAGVLQAATAALAAARERVAGWSLDREGWTALRGGLKRTYARGRTAFKAARRQPTPARLHEWRKEVKYHQHQIRLLRQGWTAALRVRREALDELGELLGDDHDLALLSELLRRTPGAPSLADDELEAIQRILSERRAELERAAFELGARLYVERPRHLVRRLAAYLDVDATGAAPREADATTPSSPGVAAHPAATSAGTKLA